MADSIVRLRVDSKEYDDKLKRAQQGMLHLQQTLQDAGKTFDQADKSAVDYARAIGQMQTVSKTAKGSLSEMSSTFVNLTAQYQKLTDAEKNSPFGKALASSLEQLKTRVQEGRSQLDDINRSLQQTKGKGDDAGGMLDKLASRFTINFDAIKMFNVGLQAAQGALKVAKDAFMANESAVDEWGRIVQSSQSLYEGFLNALNTGDISGYLSRIDSIVSAARTAYDELDRLGTLRTLQGPATSKQEAENNRLRMMIQTGKYIAPLDDTPTTIANGTQLNAAQIKFYEQKLEQGINSLISLSKNEIKQTTKAIDAYYGSLAQQTGMSIKEFREGTSSMSAFDERVRGAKAYNDWQMAHSYVDQQSGRLIQPRTGNPYAQYRGWDAFRVDKMGQNSFNDLVNLIKQNQQQISSVYSMQGTAYRTINRAEGVTVRQIMGGGGGGGGGRGGAASTATLPEIYPENSLKSLTAEMQELQKAQSLVTSTDEWRTYQHAIEGVQDQIKELKGELGIDALRDMKGISMVDTVNVPTAEDMVKRGQQRLDKFKAPETPKREEVKLSEVMGQMNSGISSMVSGIEGLGIELPKGLKDVLGGIQSVTSILTGIATIVSTIQAISAADAIIPFAHGGVARAAIGLSVPGTTFSGDMIPARLNAGETVLNTAQSSFIASALQSRGDDSVNVLPYVDGEKVFLGMNNSTKRMGRGEIVTTSMLRKYGLI